MSVDQSIQVRIRDDFPSDAHAGCFGTVEVVCDDWCYVHLNGAPEWELLKVRWSAIEDQGLAA